MSNDCQQVNVTFFVSYKKNNADSNGIKSCATIVKSRFENIGGPLVGAQKLREIQPNGLAKLTSDYSSTPVNGYTCDEGDLLQAAVCGKWRHLHKH